MQSNVIVSNPDIMGGTPVFRGTRVPMQTLIEYLESGQSIEYFLEGLPSVGKSQLIEFFEETKTYFIKNA